MTTSVYRRINNRSLHRSISTPDSSMEEGGGGGKMEGGAMMGGMIDMREGGQYRTGVGGRGEY